MLSDSSRILQKYVKVGIPYGASANLISVESRLPETFTPNNNTRYASIPPVTLSKPLTVRGRQMVTVIIAPVQGSTIYREIEISIGFSGGEDMTRGRIQNDPFFDRIFKTAVANYDRFRLWASPERTLAGFVGGGY